MNTKIILIGLSIVFFLSFETHILKIGPRAQSNIDFSQNPTGKELVIDISEGKEKEMITLINELRRKKGLGVLKFDQSLTNGARYHAADMAKEGYFEHKTHNIKNGILQEGLATFDRANLFYAGQGYVNTENCAYGSSTAEASFQIWVGSPVHYRNMLSSDAKSIGIGYFYSEDSEHGSYWVMDTATE